MSIKRRLARLEQTIKRKLPKLEDIPFREPTLEDLRELKQTMPEQVFRELFAAKYEQLKRDAKP